MACPQSRRGDGLHTPKPLETPGSGGEALWVTAGTAVWGTVSPGWAALRLQGEGASTEGVIGARTAEPSPTLALCALRPGGHPLPAERGARPQLRDRDGAPGERGGGHRPHPQPGGGIRESCGGSCPRWAGVTGLCHRLTPPVPTAGRRGRQRGAAAVPEAPCP